MPRIEPLKNTSAEGATFPNSLNAIGRCSAGEDFFADNFIVRGGKVITGMDEIRDDIEATIIEGDCLEQEIDMNIEKLNETKIIE